MVANDLLRVTRIRVDGLFDRYSHDVELRLADRVTIIHGPNGAGKTALLRLTAALLTGRLLEFSKVPFDTFEVFLSDDSIFGAAKSPSDGSRKVISLPRFYLRNKSEEVESYELKTEYSEVVRLASRIERESPWLIRVGTDQFSDRRTGEVFSPLDLIMKFPEFLPEGIRKEGTYGEPEWLQNIRSRVGIHLIEAQRLLRFVATKEAAEYRHYYAGPGYPPQDQYVETVKDYAKDLQRRISESLTLYAKESQSLDQSFPERLLNAADWTGLPVKDLKDRMQQLEEKRQRLKRIGLIGEDAAYPFDVSALEKVTAAQRSVMTLYVDDTAKKLGVLDQLARRVETMVASINRKFQHKTIQINKEKGLTAVTADGKELELAALSSGEQHELVLVYDLLFRVKPNTLVLIDEPELSLHVTWQKSFLPDLLEIVAETQFDVLLATHSPFIVGDRTDFMVELQVSDPHTR